MNVSPKPAPKPVNEQKADNLFVSPVAENRLLSVRAGWFKIVKLKNKINMKQVHSLMWFEENFQTKMINGYYHCFGTCNGMDYTFASDSEENARLLAESYLKKNGHLFDERQNEIIALKDKIERNKKEFEKHMLEVGERNRSKLMSIYYMLDAVSKTGTHREKQTVIMYQKSIIEDLINKGDVLPFDYPDGLPF